MKSFLKFTQMIFDSIAWLIGTIFLTGTTCACILGLYIVGTDIVGKRLHGEKQSEVKYVVK